MGWIESSNGLSLRDFIFQDVLYVELHNSYIMNAEWHDLTVKGYRGESD